MRGWLSLFCFVLLVSHTLPNRSFAQDLGDSLEIIVSNLAEEAVPVGDQFQLRFEVQVPGDVDQLFVTLTDPADTPVRLGLVERQPDGTFLITARAIRSGEYRIPLTIEARFGGSDTTVPLRHPPVLMTFSQPEGVLEPELRPLTEPRVVPFDFTLRNIIIATSAVILLLLLIVLIVLLLRYLERKAKQVAPAIVIPPIQEAINSVRSLRDLRLFHEKGADAHYTALSTSLRRYLEKQYHCNALELTEDEVIRLVKKKFAAIPHASDLPEVLSRSSLAKFARQPLTEELAEKDIITAEAYLAEEARQIDEALQREAEQRRRNRERAA